MSDVGNPHRGDDDEPEGGDRGEEARHAGGAAVLHREQARQHRDGGGNDVGLESGVDDLQSLDRREHRDCRRNHGVAEKEGGADHAEEEHETALAPKRVLHERHQGQDAAFALVVRLHQQIDVFEGDDDDERPQQQRHDAEHVLAGNGAARRGVRKRFAQGIERAGADVAEHDADAGKGKAELGRRLRDMAIVAGRLELTICHEAGLASTEGVLNLARRA